MDNIQKMKISTNDSIESRFNTLKENFTPVNVIRYIDYLRTQSNESILENANFIFVEPTRGVEFLIEAVQLTPEKNIDSLSKVKESITSFYTKAISSNYENKEHLTILAECLITIDSMLEHYSSTEYLKESMLNHLYESSIVIPQFEDETDVIVTEGFNELADGAEKINIAMTKPFSRAGVLTAHSIMLKSLSKIKTKDQREKQLQRTAKMIKNNELVIARYKKDQKAIDDSKGALRVVAKTTTALINPAYTPKGNIETLEYAVKKIKEYEYKLKALPLTEHVGTMAADIIYGEDEEFTNVKHLKQLDFAIGFVDTFLDDSDEINLESFNRMMQAANEYEALMEEETFIEEIVTEGRINKIVKKAAIKANELSRKAASNTRKGMDESRRVKVIVGKIPSHFEALVNNTINRVKNVDVKERRKRIIEGSFRLKLFKLIRNSILFGAAWAVNPAVAAVGLLTTIAFDKQVDEKVRKQILSEMEAELRMVTEKIEDARGDQNKQKKYQLMRIKDKLEKDIERIKYRLDAVSVSSRGVHI